MQPGAFEQRRPDGSLSELDEAPDPGCWDPQATWAGTLPWGRAWPWHLAVCKAGSNHRTGGGALSRTPGTLAPSSDSGRSAPSSESPLSLRYPAFCGDSGAARSARDAVATSATGAALRTAFRAVFPLVLSGLLISSNYMC